MQYTAKRFPVILASLFLWKLWLNYSVSLKKGWGTGVLVVEVV